jgi:hypothetical protein
VSSLPLSVKVTLILSVSVGWHSWVGDRILRLQGTPFTKANLTRSGFDIPHFHSPSLDVTHAHDLQKEYCIPPQSLFFLWPGQA